MDASLNICKGLDFTEASSKASLEGLDLRKEPRTAAGRKSCQHTADLHLLKVNKHTPALRSPWELCRTPGHKARVVTGFWSEWLHLESRIQWSQTFNTFNINATWTSKRFSKCCISNHKSHYRPHTPRSHAKRLALGNEDYIQPRDDQEKSARYKKNLPSPCYYSLTLTMRAASQLP